MPRSSKTADLVNLDHHALKKEQEIARGQTRKGRIVSGCYASGGRTRTHGRNPVLLREAKKKCAENRPFSKEPSPQLHSEREASLP